MARFTRRDAMKVVLAAAVALFCGAAAMEPAAAADLAPVSLRLKWLPQAQFAGYYVAKAKGWYADEGLDLTINPGGPNIIGENMVGAGSDTFGHGGGAASLLQAREKGLGILGIGMLFQETPYRLVALEKSGVKTFKDLKGKTVSTWFTGPQFMVQAMLRANGLDPKDVKIEAQANSMVPFIEGKVDVATVTVFNEALVLKRRNVTPAVTFNPADMGVNIPNESLIVNEKFAREHPKLVEGFLKASLRGWKYALTHQDEAVDILLKQAPTADRTEQKEQLAALVPLMTYGPAKDKGIGYIDPKALTFADKFLVENGVLKQPVDLKAAVDTSFWEKVPAADKVMTAAQ
ncbi:MAG TPA: ABC transporter substrate-binding protein [Casimicrobiaceae bacterium]|nr:ABC transporter substrate-binding protein [Casimicrobiaceae bacterium]